MDDEEVNTTHRYNHYCLAKHEDGRVCSLYKPHEGLHKAKNDLETDRWEAE